MDQREIERIEIDLLLESIFRRYGFEFRNYARASIERRVRNFAQEAGCRSVSDMIPRLLHDESFFEEMLQRLSVVVTEMFRDPPFFSSLRENVFPVLQTYPHLKVWVAGCATGESTYSLAILLAEEGLYERATVYATDFNDEALARAKEGIYALDGFRRFAKNYRSTGGRKSFSDYCHAHYDSFIIDSGLKRNITFANHNLTTDGIFGEMHLILCRNVLIYFNKTLQNRVLKLFADSLAFGGYLGLGSKETLRFSETASDFEPVDSQWKIYRKKAYY